MLCSAVMVDATPKPQPRARKAGKRLKAGKRSKAGERSRCAAAPRLSWNEIIAEAWATDRSDPAWEKCGNFSNSEGE